MVMRHQLVLGYESNLPEDVAVTTWHTQSVLDPEVEAGIFGTELLTFLTTGGVGEAIEDLLSPIIDGALCILKSYDLSDTPPRAPVAVADMPLTINKTPAALPEEVALCLSFEGLPVSGLNQARRRGRVYLGPWNVNMNTDTTNRSRPNPGVVEDIALRANTMRANLILEDVVWGVWSPTASNFTAIDRGWIDDAWDTQRRRGPAATSRETWGVI